MKLKNTDRPGLTVCMLLCETNPLKVLMHVQAHTRGRQKRERDYIESQNVFCFPSNLIIVCLRPENKILLINSHLVGINAGSSPGKYCEKLRKKREENRRRRDVESACLTDFCLGTHCHLVVEMGTPP